MRWRPALFAGELAALALAACQAHALPAPVLPPRAGAAGSVETVAVTAPASTSLTMGGLGAGGCAFTPTRSGTVILTVQAKTVIATTSSAAGDGIQALLTYGTGTAPTNGAAAAGTTVGGAMQRLLPAAITAQDITSTAWSAVVTGLAPGTAYWFDLQQAQMSAHNNGQYKLVLCSWAEL